MKRMAVFSALLTVAILGTAGCTEDPAGKPRTDKVDAAKESNKADEFSEQEESTDYIQVGLSGTVKWSDKLTAKVSGFKRGKSSAYAAPANKPYLRFTITLDNAKGTEVVDLAGTMATCSTGEEIFDTDKGLEGVPSQKLLRGDKRSWEMACEFSSKDEKIQIEVTPGTTSDEWYRAGIFTGKVS